MRALLVAPPSAGVTLADRPEPIRGPGEVKVRVVEVGVCGTDRDIARGKYGTPPEGERELILGHENLGLVTEAGPDTPGFAAGDLVVATVRRACGRCRFCAAGRSDFCESGAFTERGIRGRHGYFAEYYTERPEYLVHVPDPLRSVGVLLEPLSVVEKAVAEGQAILGRYEPTPGHPRTRAYAALVTGTGAIGMLAALVLAREGYEVTAIDRHDGGTVAPLLARIGARHANVAEGLGALGPARFDLVVEASGSAALDFALVDYLAPNGALVLTGIPNADDPAFAVSGGRLLRELVLENQAIVGSVNANRTYFERGVTHLAEFGARWGDVAERLVTERRPLEQFADALEGKSGSAIKSVLTVAR